MAGTINLSLSQQLDSSGAPLNGGLLYFFQAGTTTPQDAFQDVNLTIEHPNPITLDSAGRVPQFFLADGNIKIRLTDASGIVQIAQDNILVIGPSSGGGGGDTVDPATIYQTGDVKSRYGTGVHTGWVRINGRTIGSATSGATERANADTQSLFEYLWTNDSNLSVSGGRGGSANADWVANKTIALPDGRGRVLAALDDMGNSAASRLTSSYFGATATTLGASGGSESRTLTASQLPANIPNSAASVVRPGNATKGGTGLDAAVGTGANIGPLGNASILIDTTVTINPSGGSAHATVQPTLLVTNYIKL